MKESPILFSGPMVRALLAGTKTQTRRIAKDVKHRGWGTFYTPSALAREPQHTIDLSCPYGGPGDRLWVRESWSPDPPCDGTWAYTAWAGCRLGQIAGVPERFQHPAFCNYAADWLHGPITWTPSIHMPRWASRILLEVTSVRVERLQDISETDAQAEGIEFFNNDQERGCRNYMDKAGRDWTLSPRESFRSLWQFINGPASWDANPWVWVPDFKHINKPQTAL